ncbi:transcriptional regulator, AraC family [Catenulispora acidiphila DSM 44928]|uniref:Transcriptional regulator, AraC family n=1 Tax=Catenulispora acidiphila (strain DSM 44928 / JCM 14897 / NBRC 102108 / NRRL B-24433 / ID139908) TaxID=479433 RepID=C7PWM6_CATAD|nr:transcriptional regulator, AraC family [Catenulispora acidiphila DSM 44928]
MFHAHIVDYAYPPHCHDTWTVLIVDAGAIRYDLDTRHCGASRETVAILPPGVIHDGRPDDRAREGFWKRNIYLNASMLPTGLTGAAVDKTNLHDPFLRAALVGLHESLTIREEPLDGEARLAMIAERIAAHLLTRRPRLAAPETSIAHTLRQLLDEHLTEPITLQQAARSLDRSVPHLIRSFRQAFAISPHAYVIGRRVEAARGMLLRGAKPAAVAVDVGFYDQAHFTRHFKKHTSVSPAKYAAGGR